VAGSYFTFVYGGGAADATDFIIDTGADANFFIGGVTFHDTDDGAVSVVFSDGNSNSKLQVNVPAAAQIHVMVSTAPTGRSGEPLSARLHLRSQISDRRSAWPVLT
jgi:hypothetical protein